MIDYSDYDTTSALPRHIRLGIALAITGWDMVLDLLNDFAQDNDFTPFDGSTTEYPDNLIKGVSVAVFWGLVEDVYHRDWFNIGSEQSQECLDTVCDLLLADWNHIPLDEVIAILERIHELYSNDDSLYLIRIAETILPGENDITVLSLAAIHYSAHMIFTQPPLLNHLSELSDSLLTECIVEHFQKHA